MQPFVPSTELKFREEATKRLLQDFYDDRNLDGLMEAALLLNELWHQQAAIAQWMAHEAAENLNDAYVLLSSQNP